MKKDSNSRVENGAGKETGNGASQPAAATPLSAVGVHHEFERQARLDPRALAVTACGTALTYGELNAKADTLAGQLRALGVASEVVVGLCLHRSAATLVGALAILKAGGAYLPLDPSDPRSAFMLRDAGVAVVITEPALRDKARGDNLQVITLDDSGDILSSPQETNGKSARRNASLISTGPEHLAYVIYTSGSTGTPKGVEITHGNLLNLVSWHRNAFQVMPRDRASHVAKVGFDAGVWEIWPYLTAGASLHVADEETLNDPEAFQSWLIEKGITIGFVPTPMAERLLALPWPEKTPLRLMLTGGDALHSYPPPGLPFLLVNNYGPTECTVVATSGVVAAESSANRLPPIGRPIANTQVWIFDESMREVPPGTSGELYIGGAGVARGYRHQPELTAERFVPNPFSETSERLFKTGDLGHYLPDEQIAFAGRADDQIKIRGFRIEPNEIIAVLNEHPAISQSAVQAREMSPGDIRLVAYLVLAPENRPGPGELREFVGARLPAYMVPATFVVLDSLPLTPSGKVDRKALPAPDDANTLSDHPARGPQTEIEEIVAGILAPLLHVEHVDVEANFFALGGHSLLGIQLISRVRECLGVELSLRTVFEAPSVVDLSAQIEQLLCAKLESMSEEEVQRSLNQPEKTL